MSLKESKNIVNKLVLTRVECEIDGDVFYPQIDLSIGKKYQRNLTNATAKMNMISRLKL